MFFAIPTFVHAWPNSAACWSPAMPVIGAATPANASGSLREISPLEEFVMRALDVARVGVAILARTVFLESSGRYNAIFRDTPT